MYELNILIELMIDNEVLTFLLEMRGMERLPDER